MVEILVAKVQIITSQLLGNDRSKEEHRDLIAFELQHLGKLLMIIYNLMLDQNVQSVKAIELTVREQLVLSGVLDQLSSIGNY